MGLLDFCKSNITSKRDEYLREKENKVAPKSWNEIWEKVVSDEIRPQFSSFDESLWCMGKTCEANGSIEQGIEKQFYAYWRIRGAMDGIEQPLHYFIRCGDIEGVGFCLAARMDFEEVWESTCCLFSPISPLVPSRPLNIAVSGEKDSHVAIASMLIKELAKVASEELDVPRAKRKLFQDELSSIKKTSRMEALIDIAYAEECLKQRKDKEAILLFESAKQKDIVVFIDYMGKILWDENETMHVYSDHDREAFFCVPGVLALASAKNKFVISELCRRKLKEVGEKDNDCSQKEMNYAFAKFGLQPLAESALLGDRLAQECLQKLAEENRGVSQQKDFFKLINRDFTGRSISANHEFHWHALSKKIFFVAVGLTLVLAGTAVLLALVFSFSSEIIVTALMLTFLGSLALGYVMSKRHEKVRGNNLKQLSGSAEKHEGSQKDKLKRPNNLKQDEIEHLSTCVLELEDHVAEILFKHIVEDYENVGFRKKHPVAIQFLSFGLYANHQSIASWQLIECLKSNAGVSEKRQNVRYYLLDKNNYGKQLFCNIVSCVRENYRCRGEQFVEHYMAKQPLTMFKFKMPESKPCESEAAPLLQGAPPS